ncbi:MAG: hypothetical protein OXF46_10575 [Rhodobacteraceae bacterium]|nr:hypothetical protein [Paracoccaceae bacterium]
MKTSTSANLNLQWLDPVILEFASEDFLLRKSEPTELLIFSLAQKQAGNIHAMISRALILLRLSTGVVHSLFHEAGFDPEEGHLQSLFDTFGIDRGLWSANQHPEEVDDLWSEVKESLQLLEKCLSKKPVDQYSFVNYFSEFDQAGENLLFLSQAERACIWGLGR